MKRKLGHTIAMLSSISKQRCSGSVDVEDVEWLIENSRTLANQLDILVNIVTLSTGYTTSEIEDCISDLETTGVTIH